MVLSCQKKIKRLFLAKKKKRPMWGVVERERRVTRDHVQQVGRRHCSHMAELSFRMYWGISVGSSSTKLQIIRGKESYGIQKLDFKRHPFPCEIYWSALSFGCNWSNPFHVRKYDELKPLATIQQRSNNIEDESDWRTWMWWENVSSHFRVQFTPRKRINAIKSNNLEKRRLEKSSVRRADPSIFSLLKAC